MVEMGGGGGGGAWKAIEAGASTAIAGGACAWIAITGGVTLLGAELTWRLGEVLGLRGANS
jgi:hypothetical protein